MTANTRQKIVSSAKVAAMKLKDPLSVCTITFSVGNLRRIRSVRNMRESRNTRKICGGAYVSIRQHTSAYVSVCSGRAGTPAGSAEEHASAYVSIRQHTSAHVSTRQRMRESRNTRRICARNASKQTQVTLVKLVVCVHVYACVSLEHTPARQSTGHAPEGGARSAQVSVFVLLYQ